MPIVAVAHPVRKGKIMLQQRKGIIAGATALSKKSELGTVEELALDRGRRVHPLGKEARLYEYRLADRWRELWRDGVFSNFSNCCCLTNER